MAATKEQKELFSEITAQIPLLYAGASITLEDLILVASRKSGSLNRNVVTKLSNSWFKDSVKAGILREIKDSPYDQQVFAVLGKR